MSLQDYVNESYIENFAVGIVKEYEEQRNYPPYSEEEIEEILKFAKAVCLRYNVESAAEIQTASLEDKEKLDSFLSELIDAIISLLSFTIMYKAEEVKLKRDIKELKRRISDE